MSTHIIEALPLHELCELPATVRSNGVCEPPPPPPPPLHVSTMNHATAAAATQFIDLEPTPLAYAPVVATPPCPPAVPSFDPTPLWNLPAAVKMEQVLVTPPLRGADQPRRVSLRDDDEEPSTETNLRLQSDQQQPQQRRQEPLQQQQQRPKEASLALHRALSRGGARVRPKHVLAAVRCAPRIFFVRDRRGRTPLLLALERRCSVDVILALVEASREAACVPDRKMTLPIHIAARGHYPLEVVRALVRAFPEGAATAKDFHGRTALDVASSRGGNASPSHDELINYLQGLSFDGIERRMVVDL